MSYPLHPSLPIICILVFACGCSKRDSAGETDPPVPSTSETPVTATLPESSPPPAMAMSAERDPASPDTTPLTQIAPGTARKDFIAPLKDAYDRIDPTKDGWESEAFSAAALDQLHELESLLLSPESANEASLAPLVADTITSTSLRPRNLQSIFDDDGLSVRRLSSPPSEPSPPFKGNSDFLQQLKLLGEGNSPERTRIKLKIVRIEPLADGRTRSQVLCTATRSSAEDRVQINATWDCVWQNRVGKNPLLAEVRVEKYEEIVQARSGTALFEDCTAGVLGANASYKKQILTSTDHWRARLPSELGLDPVANHGLALGDINGDDLDDLYVCQQGGLPNRMFLRQPDGTLRDVTAESGTDWLDYCSAALFLDLDNDGDRDLVVSQDFHLLVMSNDGSGKFTLELGAATKAQSFSLAAADFDRDGLVDIYVCGYNPSVAELRGGAMGEPMPFHDANNGGPNMLWRNAGDFHFEDATESSGMNQNNTRYSFAAAWEDFDNDGDQDLYVANDYGRNCLYRNENGAFTDVAAEMRVEDTSSGMSVSWSDFNRDGLMDLYTSNMFSSAGNRITYQRQFKEGLPEAIRKQFQHIALGNTLFEATGPDAPFKDVGVEAGVTMGRWAWGSRFVDFNNDGFDDLVVANGFLSTEDTEDL